MTRVCMSWSGSESTQWGVPFLTWISSAGECSSSPGDPFFFFKKKRIPPIYVSDTFLRKHVRLIELLSGLVFREISCLRSGCFPQKSVSKSVPCPSPAPPRKRWSEGRSWPIGSFLWNLLHRVRRRRSHSVDLVSPGFLSFIPTQPSC